MALAAGTMTGRLPATAAGKGERPRQGIARNVEAGSGPSRAVAKLGSDTARGNRDVRHLDVIIPSARAGNNSLAKCFSKIFTPHCRAAIADVRRLPIGQTAQCQFAWPLPQFG